MSSSPSDPEFWRERYQRESQGWEIGRAAPPLARWFAQHPPAGKRVLVVGCGRGHEARLVAAAGAQVVAIDFAQEALAEARALAARDQLRLVGASGATGSCGRGGSLDFRARDLFALGRDPERYDLVVEHCCFCAIDPARRDEYIDVVAEVLADGGQLVGLFRTHGKPGGPPFMVAAGELERLFTRRFVFMHSSVPDDSIESRRGAELLVNLERR